MAAPAFSFGSESGQLALDLFALEDFDDVAFADVEFAVEEDGVGPAGALVGAGEFEVADFHVLFRVGFD